jgi:predicted site-specific integrase-resolvase
MSNDKQFLTPGEAAKVLQVSRWTILRWIDKGHFEGVIRPGFGPTAPHKIPVDSINTVAKDFGLETVNGSN